MVKVAVYHLGEKAISSGGHAAGCAGAIQGKEVGSMSTSIRLGWNWLTATNTLAYQAMASVAKLNIL